MAGVKEETKTEEVTDQAMSDAGGEDGKPCDPISQLLAYFVTAAGLRLSWSCFLGDR